MMFESVGLQILVVYYQSCCMLCMCFKLMGYSLHVASTWLAKTKINNNVLERTHTCLLLSIVTNVIPLVGAPRGYIVTSISLWYCLNAGTSCDIVAVISCDIVAITYYCAFVFFLLWASILPTST